jgi:hypothetical protein
MTPEQIETELKHVATKEDLALLKAGISDLRAELKAGISDLRAEMYKAFAGLTTTLWITQLSATGLTLVGVGLLIHFKL